ncbi:M23 family metallopeptidase [Candidatus Peregrinibacteria bacterium]|nr:M23 family metallopeptidase [Candidatus Peregrinibacteria bacterium]
MENVDSGITGLSNKVVAFAVLFIMLFSLAPLYDSAQGAYGLDENEDGLAVEDLRDYITTSQMTDDGFMLKPSIASVASDRSHFGNILVYTVESGDTLSNIASRFRLKKETIMWENDLYNEHLLRAGTRIRILPVDGISYKVGKGDTLAKIAKKYKVGKETLIKQNQLADETLIADAMLIIPGAQKEIPRYIASRGYISPAAPDSGKGYSYQGPSSTSMIWPTQGKITQGYTRKHFALDIANRSAGPIFAAASGTVVKATNGWNGGYGNMVIIDHGKGMQTLYAHMKKFYVNVGQTISQGDTIGWMGNTGRVYGVTGIHLHFEVRVNGIKYNPLNYF